jgi:hypothetical protein
MVPYHDAPFAGPIGAWGAGPILMAASCSHSPGRCTAHPGWLSGLRWRSPSVCFYCLVCAVRYCRRRRSSGSKARTGGHFAGLDIAPQRHQQLAGERHDHDLANAPLAARGALDEPAAERAVRLEAQPAPEPAPAKAGANCISSRRTRGLPFLLMPCSRSEPPLLNGVPVRPTKLAIALRSRNVRQNTSRVSTVAVPNPNP